MTDLVLYVHGKGGSAAGAAHYVPLFPDARVVGLDYTADTPWDALPELRARFDALCAGASSVTLIAESLGAYFSMIALGDRPIDRACFISPVCDMERLITDMMGWAGVTEDRLRAEGEIPTPFGETLSWDYLSWVRAHPVSWHIPTRILYAAGDTMIARDTVETFANRTGAELTVTEGGEHWFHTEEEMAVVDGWVCGKVKSE